MRVTKTIKEYITEQVKAKFPITEEEKEIKQKIEEISDKIDLINNKIKEYALDLCETANKALQIDHWTEYESIHLNNSFGVTSGYNNPYENELRALRRKREGKINEKVKEIIVTLELGGTKADLDKMLTEVGE